MKANAPKKIYLNPLLMEDGESIVRRCTFERQRDSQIEYIRKDAFIEKVCSWLEGCINNGMWIANDVGSAEKEAIIESFKEYMK